MSLRVCSVPGCPTLTAAGRCQPHERQADQARGTRQQRGYTNQHDRLRKHWAPLVATGNVRCARCDEPIAPDEPWALDHTEDRTGYLGPSHKVCNDRAGGRAAHR